MDTNNDPYLGKIACFFAINLSSIPVALLLIFG